MYNSSHLKFKQHIIVKHMQTSMSLITACREDRYPSQGVFFDYFGRCTTKTEVDIVRDVYKDLIFQKGVEEKLLRNCFQSNRLNELVHTRNKHAPSLAYTRFRLKDLDLTTHTCLDPLPSEEWLPLLSDDHCPRCKTVGYITQDTKFDKRCVVCSKWMCCWCIHEDEETCIKCS